MENIQIVCKKININKLDIKNYQSSKEILSHLNIKFNDSNLRKLNE